MRNNILRKAAKYSIPLISGIIIALAWANLSPDSYHSFWYTKIGGIVNAHFLVNDIFMVFFFAIAGIEIVSSCSPGGNLSPVKKAVSPIIATIGGLLGPIIVFFCLNYFIGSPDYRNGWAIATATDIAMSLLFARMIFSRGHSAIIFLLLLAVLDDAVGLMIIAVFYPDPLSPVTPIWLLLLVAGMFIAWLFSSKLKIKSYWPYLLVPGVLAWVGMLNSSLHPALSFVFIAPFLPNTPEEGKKYSTMIQFEKDIKYPVEFGLFFFGLANAGVVVSNVSILTLIVFMSLFVGKTLGIFGLTKIACRCGYSAPPDIGDKELFLLSMIAGVGLTVALFTSNLAYTDTTMQAAAKMGALLSLFIGFIALFINKFLFNDCGHKDK